MQWHNLLRAAISSLFFGLFLNGLFCYAEKPVLPLTLVLKSGKNIYRLSEGIVIQAMLKPIVGKPTYLCVDSPESQRFSLQLSYGSRPKLTLSPIVVQTRPAFSTFEKPKTVLLQAPNARQVRFNLKQYQAEGFQWQPGEYRLMVTYLHCLDTSVPSGAEVAIPATQPVRFLITE